MFSYPKVSSAASHHVLPALETDSHGSRHVIPWDGYPLVFQADVGSWVKRRFERVHVQLCHQKTFSGSISLDMISNLNQQNPLNTFPFISFNPSGVSMCSKVFLQRFP